MPNPNLKENKLKRFIGVCSRNIIKALSKKKYVELQYKYITGHKLNLKNPIRYTEKLQYLRLYTYPKNKDVIRCAGRVGVREYLNELGLQEYLIKTYGIFDSYDDIDFAKLPNQFVMKCTHGSGMNFICYDKEKIDHKSLKKKFNCWLKTNYGKKTVEMHYSPIKPQIIIEELMLENGKLPTEYKIHVFNGVAKYLYVVTSRNVDIRYNNYYIDWTPFDGAQFNGWKKTDYPLEIPENFKNMVVLSENLAKIFPFVRVDLYTINGKIYFSEMTFTPAKGTLIFDDDNADFEIGKWLDISSYISSN